MSEGLLEEHGYRDSPASKRVVKEGDMFFLFV